MLTAHLLPAGTAALVVGMLLGLLAGAAAGPVVGVLALLAAGFAVRRVPGLPLLLGLPALGLWLVRGAEPVARDGVAARALAHGQPVEVLGRVVTGPQPTDTGGARLRVLPLSLGPASPEPEQGRARAAAPVIEAGAWDAAGMIEVTVGNGRPQALPGDTIAFAAPLVAPRGFANPGAPDARLLAAAQGVTARAFVARPAQLRLLASGASWRPRRIAHRAHQAMRARIEAALDPRAAAFLRTAVLGERTASGDEVELGFKAAGATHALSVSGLHLAAVAAVCFLLVRRLAGLWPALALRVVPGRLAAAVSLPAVLFYTLLAGEAVATWRSALMAASLFLAVLLGRAPSVAHAIAIAALVLLCESPLVLLDVSFQLSFVSVLALALFAGALAPGTSSGVQASTPALPRARRAVTGWVGRGLAATAAAGLLTTPLVAHHFGEFTPAAPIGNLLLTPQVELLVVPLGLLGAALACVAPWLGWLPLQLARAAAHLCLATAELFARWAPVWSCRHPDPLATLLCTLGLGAALAAWIARGAPGWGRPGRWAWMALALLLGATGSLTARELLRRTRDDLRVTFLDVGQGDAALIEGPRGFVALIDGGGLPGSAVDVGARAVEPTLRRKGIGRLDLVIVSHPHPDHFQGLFRVVDRFAVGEIWALTEPGKYPELDRLLALAAARGVPHRPPSRREHAGLVIEPLGPWRSERGPRGEFIDRIGWPDGLGANDASLTVRLSFAGRALLFPGDLEQAGELELCGRARAGLLGPDGLRADVLKVPHHGSRTSSTEELLARVRPGRAVISDGVRNRYGFPSPEVLERYRAHGIPTLRTDLSGAVTLRIAGDGRIEATCVLGCR